MLPRQARFSAPAAQLLLSDGSLLLADGQRLRRVEMKALRDVYMYMRYHSITLYDMYVIRLYI